MEDEHFQKIFPFKEDRQYQRFAIEKAISAFESGKKHVILCAPTGIGKSAIAKAIANHFEMKNRAENENILASYFLTSQKILQSQYENDLKIPSIKGKSNYFCNRNENLSCEFGECSTSKKPRGFHCPDCPYYKARDFAFQSQHMVTNYSYFLGINSNSEIVTKRSLLVCDECHNTEKELIESCAINLCKKDLIKHGLAKAFISFPVENEYEERKFDWLFDEVIPKFKDEVQKNLNQLENISKTNPAYVKILRLNSYMVDIISTACMLKNEIDRGVHCVVDQPDSDSITYKLVFGGPMANERLFNYSDYVLSMSATILSKSQYCRNLCIKESEAEWIECPSVFDKANRKVFVCDVGSMSWKNKSKTMPKIISKISNLLDEHSNERGIIHTVNYELTNFILENVNTTNRDRLVIPKGKERDETIQMFMESTKDDLVLLSPSLSEGIDLKDDLSRFTIIAKVPWASLADKWVKRRNELDPEWYKESAITNIIQMTGRSVRSETDFAVGYILDSDFSFLFSTTMRKFPKWWKEALVSE